MPTFDIWFRGALDAVDNTALYKLYGDETTAGTFAELVASQPATSPFTPVSAAIAGAIGASPTVDRQVNLPSASFAAGEIIQIDRESIKLGAEGTDIFTNCIRAWGSGNIPQAHAQGAIAYKMHEKFTRTYAWPTSPYIRRMVRYKIARIVGSEESVVSWAAIYNHPKPPGIDWCTVWGTIYDYLAAAGTAVDGVLDVSGHGGFLTSLGDMLKDHDPEADTNLDGYFYAYVPRGVSFVEKPTIKLQMPVGGTTYERTLTVVPDQDFCHWWQCSSAA
jgi:hypothetical protein